MTVAMGVVARRAGCWCSDVEAMRDGPESGVREAVDDGPRDSMCAGAADTERDRSVCWVMGCCCGLGPDDGVLRTPFGGF